LHQIRPNGTTFTVPPEDVQVPTPTVGDVVSFSYEVHARRDTPVNPSIYRIRHDLLWDDVLNSFGLPKEEPDCI
jgi:hypothetical protein